MSELPNDIAAERAVLGALLSGAQLSEVRPLDSPDFYRPAHQIVFEAIARLAAAGKPADAVAVGDELRRATQLSRMGGAPYLHTLISSVPAAVNAGYYARIVGELAVRRRVIELSDRIGQAARNPAEDLRAIAGLAVGQSDMSDSRQNLAALLTSHSDGSDTSDSGRDQRLLANVRGGQWLGSQQFPPLRFAVPGLIPEGFTLLIGAPKIGKSWFVLDLLLGLASGGRILGQIRAGDPRPVLYMALEDSDRRMQDRCRALLGEHDEIPALFSYQTRVEPGMVLTTIEAWMRCYGDTGLVVVDTLGKVMPPAAQGETSYGRDYRIGSALKAIADATPGLAVLVNHHDRKASAEDFIDSVSGTHGLAGAADSIAVLARKRQSGEGTLKITGRDIPEDEYALALIEGKSWQLDGDNLHAAASAAAQRTAARSISATSADVLAYVNQFPEGIRARAVVDKFGKDAYQYLKRLVEAGRIDKADRGFYFPVSLSEPSEVSESQVSDRFESDSRHGATVRNDGWPAGSIGAEVNE